MGCRMGDKLKDARISKREQKEGGGNRWKGGGGRCRRPPPFCCSFLFGFCSNTQVDFWLSSTNAFWVPTMWPAQFWGRDTAMGNTHRPLPWGGDSEEDSPLMMMPYPFHVTSDEINSERRRVTCPRSHSTHDGRRGPELGSLPSCPSLLSLVSPPYFATLSGAFAHNFLCF